VAPGREETDDRILILAPTGRDAALAAEAFAEAGLTAFPCGDMDELCLRIEEGAGAAMITEEALTTASMACLREALEQQPAWADLPLLVFTSQPSAELTVRSLEHLGPRANTSLIERPIRVKTMLSAAKAALRARHRQYEIRDLVGQLHKRVEERDQFLAMLSHELRNPLAAMTLAVNSLEEQGKVSDERSIIARQTRHLGKLVDDLLDISRVTSGKIVLHKTRVDLNDIAGHCVAMMRSRADARRLALTVAAVGDDAIVEADPVRLEQIITNLLSNAVKYTPPGGSIQVSVERDAGDAVLRVRDSGKGIPAEMLTRVFEMFMQGDVSIDRSEGGMGVGLTLVKNLVEQHGGSVRAYSGGRGSGSEFVVRLPFAGRAGAVAAAAPKSAAPAVSAENGGMRRIVIIEDNADIRDLLRIKLRKLGHRVEVAEDGLKGLEKVLTVKPEIALVDIGLPALDGYEVARRVREALGASIYLVALTGYGQADDKRKALESGFNVHLTKPADFVDLQNVIGRIPVAS
jgi:signal transduction histidine kinase/CheY-like chemotaxis protein